MWLCHCPIVTPWVVVPVLMVWLMIRHDELERCLVNMGDWVEWCICGNRGHGWGKWLVVCVLGGLVLGNADGRRRASDVVVLRCCVEELFGESVVWLGSIRSFLLINCKRVNWEDCFVWYVLGRGRGWVLDVESWELVGVWGAMVDHCRLIMLAHCPAAMGSVHYPS